jgi:beta-phosphoglucomutase-like phosphatase (HAD superfamily)
LASGIPIAIGTSTEKKNVDLAIKQNKLNGFFKGIVSSEDVTEGKPNPEVFLKAAKIIKCAPRDCFVFEDSTHGIQAAKRAQMIPVGITTTNTKARLLESGAELVVDRLDEIDLSILEDLIKTAK